MNRSLDTIKPAKNAQTDKGFSGVAIKISKEEMGKIVLSFPYNPKFGRKFKTISGYRWQPEGKEKINIDSLLQTNLSNRVIARSEATKQSQKFLSPKTSFEDLRHELVSRKYSHKTVKTYGLRVREVVKLKPEDIDGKRILIHIKGARGRKDRYTLLSEKALNVLRQYWTEYKPQK